MSELESIKQRENEPISMFWDRVRSLARKADPNMPDQYLSTFVKKGLLDARLRLELMRSTPKPLEVVMQELALLEAAYTENAKFGQQESSTPSKPVFQVEPFLPAIREVRESRQLSLRELYNDNPRNKPTRYCDHCRVRSHNTADCHKLVTCQICLKKGHVAAVCYLRNSHEGRQTRQYDNANATPIEKPRNAHNTAQSQFRSNPSSFRERQQRDE